MARTHGLAATYRAGCRCRPCTIANTERQAEWVKTAEVPPDKHGTIYGYRVLRCRCDECRGANAEYQREYRARVRRAG